MQNIKELGETILEIWPKKLKSEPNLTFDPLPPANKNFRKYDILLRLKALIGSKFMPKIKKI